MHSLDVNRLHNLKPSQMLFTGLHIIDPNLTSHNCFLLFGLNLTKKKKNNQKKKIIALNQIFETST